MTVSTPNEYINTYCFDNSPACDDETLGNSCTIYVKVRDHWVKAKGEITFNEALQIGKSSALRFQLPMQIRDNCDQVLADL